MNIKGGLRRFLGFLPVRGQLLFSRLISKGESLLQFLRAAQLKRQGMKEFTLPVEGVDNEKECHILASGWSLNHSYQDIDREKSFVIGFNFSFLKCSNPDLQFIENSSTKSHGFFINTIQIYSGLMRFQVFSRSKVIFKNLSELKNTQKNIASLYAGNAFFIRDRHFRIFGEKSVLPTLVEMCKETRVLPQAISSVVGLILLAKSMGFKRIIIHGLDFYGPHFYGDNLQNVIFNDGPLPDPLHVSEVDFRFHKTAVGENGVGVVALVKAVKDECEKMGVGLYAATCKSPSMEILGLSD